MAELFAEAVYDTISGFLTEEAQIPNVENLFLPGSPCHGLMEAVYHAYDRLRDLNNADSIDEIEQILTAYEEICKIVGCKMFAYGAEFAANAYTPAE